MGKVLYLMLAALLVVSLSTTACTGEEKPTERSSSHYLDEMRHAEKSVLDFFAAIRDNDYDTYDKVSMNRHLSDREKRSAFELQQNTGLFAEDLTILSSERSSDDTVKVSVSYVLDGIDFNATYTVVLIDNNWVLDLSDMLDPTKSNAVGTTRVPTANSR